MEKKEEHNSDNTNNFSTSELQNALVEVLLKTEEKEIEKVQVGNPCQIEKNIRKISKKPCSKRNCSKHKKSLEYHHRLYRIERDRHLIKPPYINIIDHFRPSVHKDMGIIATKINFEFLNEPREDKKLLVLDLDQTLCDCESFETYGKKIIRPYLHEFLTEVYSYYDIVIWTAADRKCLNERLKYLKIKDHPNYKILFCLDRRYVMKYPMEPFGEFRIKPLCLIWAKMTQYNSKNTIIVDDYDYGSVINEENAFVIKEYLAKDHANDKELKDLAIYLVKLAKFCKDLSSVNHKDYLNYSASSDVSL